MLVVQYLFALSWGVNCANFVITSSKLLEKPTKSYMTTNCCKILKNTLYDGYAQVIDFIDRLLHFQCNRYFLFLVYFLNKSGISQSIKKECSKHFLLGHSKDIFLANRPSGNKETESSFVTSGDYYLRASYFTSVFGRRKTWKEGVGGGISRCILAC